MKYLVGVDEAGRGPLAGPVAVGVVKVPVDFDWTLIRGVGDSKKVSPA
ncbi:MAG: ribonuclease HII, partial [Patescibacteria group bacterium]